jgi:bifunctional non-homologous end joining protein LigD
VTWEEVERAFKKKDASLLVFEAKQVVARVEKMGDLFAPLLTLKQRLPDLKQVAASAAAEPEETFSSAAQAEEKPKRSRRRMAKTTAQRPPARRAKRKV